MKTNCFESCANWIFLFQFDPLQNPSQQTSSLRARGLLLTLAALFNRVFSTHFVLIILGSICHILGRKFSRLSFWSLFFLFVTNCHATHIDMHIPNSHFLVYRFSWVLGRGVCQVKISHTYRHKRHHLCTCISGFDAYTTLVALFIITTLFFIYRCLCDKQTWRVLKRNMNVVVNTP